MKSRKFEIKFKRHTDYDCIVEAVSHAKAKMLLAYRLVGKTEQFPKCKDLFRDIHTCRSLEPQKRGQKPRQY